MFKTFATAVTTMFIAGTQANEIIDGVTVLNEFSFWDAVNSNDYLFVYFYKNNWYVPCNASFFNSYAASRAQR